MFKEYKGKIKWEILMDYKDDDYLYKPTFLNKAKAIEYAKKVGAVCVTGYDEDNELYEGGDWVKALDK